MLVKRPTVNPLALDACRRIQAAGVAVTLEIGLWVQQAAEAMRDTARRASHTLVDWPVTVGNARLYRLSYAALEWHERLPDDLRDDDLVLAWACAHSMDPEALQSVTTPREVRKAVKVWAGRLTCSPGALALALDDLGYGSGYVEIKDAIPKKAIDPKRLHTRGAVITALCRRYPGTTPDLWTWKMSFDRALSYLVNEDDDEVTDADRRAHVEFLSIVNHIIETYPKTGDANA